VNFPIYFKLCPTDNDFDVLILLIILSLVQLYPDCAPYSVAYILELLALRHCAGCRFYRAEGRGESWDVKGNHIKDVS